VKAGEWSSSQPADRALGRIGFQFYVNGKSQWATGEYETYCHDGESPEEAMMRASDNALSIAFEIRDAFVSKHKEN
jgi:hypothetical protein